MQETQATGDLQRTEWNVRVSDATLIVTLDASPRRWFETHRRFSRQLGQSWLHVRPGILPKQVARFLERHGVKTLNVAGKRESPGPGIGDLVRSVLPQAARTC